MYVNQLVCKGHRVIIILLWNLQLNNQGQPRFFLRHTFFHSCIVIVPYIFHFKMKIIFVFLFVIFFIAEGSVRSGKPCPGEGAD